MLQIYNFFLNGKGFMRKSIQIFKYSNIQVFKYSSIQIGQEGLGSLYAQITKSLGRVMTFRRSYQIRLEPTKCFWV